MQAGFNDPPSCCCCVSPSTLVYRMNVNILMKLSALSSLALGMLLSAGAALAQEMPDAMIKRVSDEVMDIARRDAAIQGGNFTRIVALVQEKILPHLDMERATALATGPHWRNATPEQRQQLTAQYRDLLIYTYAGAMSQIGDQVLEFDPLRMAPDDDEVEVRSRVRLPRRPEPVQVRYRLWKAPDGWKIFDVSVLGAWLSATYRSSFSSEINRSGVDGLIKLLAEKNRQLAAAT